MNICVEEHKVSVDMIICRRAIAGIWDVEASANSSTGRRCMMSIKGVSSYVNENIAERE
jgi:hypothetical protein